ncbi:MAG: hypothetical protein ACFFD4_00870 [Candidatus Odinarchaeota archaeon]
MLKIRILFCLLLLSSSLIITSFNLPAQSVRRPITKNSLAASQYWDVGSKFTYAIVHGNESKPISLLGNLSLASSYELLITQNNQSGVFGTFRTDFPPDEQAVEEAVSDELNLTNTWVWPCCSSKEDWESLAIDYHNKLIDNYTYTTRYQPNNNELTFNKTAQDSWNTTLSIVINTTDGIANHVILYGEPSSDYGTNLNGILQISRATHFGYDSSNKVSVSIVIVLQAIILFAFTRRILSRTKKYSKNTNDS